MKNRYIFLLIAVAVVALYAPTIKYNYVSYDDEFLIVNNPLVKSFNASIFWSYDPELYIPFTFLSYQIEYAIFSGSPVGTHLINIFLHVFVSILSYLIFRRLLFTQKLALLGALIFAIHPLQVGTVAWASARKELLWTLFALLSILSYLKSSKLRDKNGIASVIFFSMALLSKVTAVSLVPLLFLVDWNRGKKLSFTSFYSKWLYIVIASIFSGIAIFGKTGDIVLSLFKTILLSIAALWFSFSKFFVPIGLTIIHPAVKPISILNLSYVLPAILISILFFLSIIYKSKFKNLVFGFWIFIILIFPSLFGYSKAGEIQLISEHYLYAPMIGLSLMFISIVALFNEKIILSKYFRIVLLLWIVPISLISSNRISDWESSEKLYSRVISVYPTSHVAYSNLAAVYLNDKSKNRNDEAISLLSKAVAINPQYSNAYFNLSIAYRNNGDFVKAQNAILRSFKLNSSLSDSFSLNVVEGDIDEMLDLYITKSKEDPLNEDVWWKLGNLYGQKGMYEEGLRSFQKAMEIDPRRRNQAEELNKLILKIKNR